MILSRAKRMLAHASISDLQEIKRYVSERISELNKRKRAALHDQAWEAVGKKAKPGMFLLLPTAFRGYVPVWRSESKTKLANYEQIALSGGTVLEVHHIRPRKRVLWVKNVAGDLYAFKPAELAEIGPANIHVFPDELRAHIARAKLCGNENGPTYSHAGSPE